jgi:hypothetical protein
MTEQVDENQALHLFCLDWADWHRSRRLFAPPIPKNLLVRMAGHIGGGEVPDAICSSDASFFNLSVLAQEESRPKMIFYLHYIHKVRHIKMVAEQMGISTSLWYREMREFRAKAWRSYRRMMDDPTENPFEEVETEAEQV